MEVDSAHPIFKNVQMLIELIDQNNFFHNIIHNPHLSNYSLNAANLAHQTVSGQMASLVSAIYMEFVSMIRASSHH